MYAMQMRLPTWRTRRCARTHNQEGPNPRWGQGFSFDVDGPVDTEFSVELLRQIRDDVHVDLFDHIEKDAELDSRLTSVEVSRLAIFVGDRCRGAPAGGWSWLWWWWWWRRRQWWWWW